MALSARIPAGVDAAGFIPELWSKECIEPVRASLVVVPQVDHRWEAELTKGDTMNVGILNTISATEVTVGTPGAVGDIATGTALQIVINQWWEAKAVIDNMTNLQTQINIKEKAVTETAYAISKKIDTTVCALFAALSSSTGYGTDGAAITDTVLMNAVEELDIADIPPEGRKWILPPSAKSDLMAYDKFVRSDYGYGDVIPTGGFRKDVFGAPVLISTNLAANTTGKYGVYMHTNALAIIVQEQFPGYTVEDKEKHQVTIATEALWGVKQMRNTFGCPILTRL